MGSEHFCLKWNNHQSNLLGVFSQLLQEQSLVDVTLACAEGHSIQAHKVVLSACSSYFQTLFVDHPKRHPIVILKDVCFAELRTLIEFMYKGEVNVEYCQLSALLKTAESLKVKGLAEMTNLNATTSASVAREKEEKIPERADPPHHQKQHILAGEKPYPTETVNKRLINEDADSPSPGPPPAKKPSRKPDCEDASDCERDGPATPDRNDAGATCPGPTDMSASAMASCQIPPSCTSHVSDPFAGTSCLPPVQQVPLSLKKEVDWESKSTAGESSSEYRHPPDSQDGEEDVGNRSPRLYPCMYCGARFPHQSKLTRHILSHSLETLKYREQPHLQIHPILGLDQLNVVDTHYATRPQKYEAFDHPPDASSDADFSTSFPLGETCQPSVVLCKFCSKSFPDVGSLIVHLAVHTGERPFKCEFCGKAFKLRHHMKDHCRVHTGERPFRCSICGKTFSRSTILKAHEKTHYPKFVHKFLAPSPLDHQPDDSSPQTPFLTKFSPTPIDAHADAGSPQPQQYRLTTWRPWRADAEDFSEPDLDERYGCLSEYAADRRGRESRAETPFQLPLLPFGGLGEVGEGCSRQSSLLSFLQQQGFLPAPLTEEGRAAAGMSSPYRCVICLAAFPSTWLLEQHKSLQHSTNARNSETGSPGVDKPFKCEQCGQSYRYRSAYLKHQDQNHRATMPADKLFACDVCGMQFRYLKSFKKHKLNHALDKLHNKSPDGETFSRSRNNGAFEKYWRTAPESSTDLSLRAKVSLFAQESLRLNGEAKESGRVTAPPATCVDGGSEQVSSSNESLGDVCPSAGINRAASVPISKADQQNLFLFSKHGYQLDKKILQTDMKKSANSDRVSDSEQDETIDSLACALSLAGPNEAFRFQQDTSLVNLLRLDPSDRQRDNKFSCPFCGKCVRSKENLKLHIRKHTGERPFVCLFCGRAFGGKSDLTRHLRIHTGERPYHCEICGKCFARADYLSKHLTTHIHSHNARPSFSQSHR